MRWTQMQENRRCLKEAINMVKRVFTQEHIDYIKQIAPDRYNYDIAEMVNSEFNLGVTEAQIKNLKTRHKIKSGLKRKRRTPNQQLFTDEQILFIKENAEGLSNTQLTDLVNRTFGLSITLNQMKGWKRNNKVTSGLTGHFEKGHVPYTKGKKQSEFISPEKLENVKVNWYRNGDTPANYEPVGTERLATDGYVRVKVQDEGEWHERWQMKHKLFWENEKGPIPEGHVLIFLDGDTTHISMDNMMLISRAEHQVMNQRGLRFEDPELTKTGAAIAKVKAKSFERIHARKETKDGE